MILKKTVSITLTTANGINYPVSHRRMGNLLDTRANMYNICIIYSRFYTQKPKYNKREVQSLETENLNYK